MTQMAIRVAAGEADMGTVRILLEEYRSYLAGNPAGAPGICIANFETELAPLPGPYTLLLAEVEGEAAGCVALKTVSRDGEEACEMKRLWVRDRFRGQGLGKKMVGAAIELAVGTGYHVMYLDTVPAAMPEANRLYASMGFELAPRYNDNAVADIVFFRLSLPIQQPPA